MKSNFSKFSKHCEAQSGGSCREPKASAFPSDARLPANCLDTWSPGQQRGTHTDPLITLVAMVTCFSGRQSDVCVCVGGGVDLLSLSAGGEVDCREAGGRSPIDQSCRHSAISFLPPLIQRKNSQPVATHKNQCKKHFWNFAATTTEERLNLVLNMK